MAETLRHQEGPGLKVVSTRKWYGGGYCGICGATDEHSKYSPLIPVAVRWWDADDGWKMGVLCQGCGDEAASRGPRKDDYAVVVKGKAGVQYGADKIDIGVEFGDEDSAYADSLD